jgi:hypothetical protein
LQKRGMTLMRRRLIVKLRLHLTAAMAVAARKWRSGIPGLPRKPREKRSAAVDDGVPGLRLTPALAGGDAEINRRLASSLSGH